ncbi:hypothetical protein QUC30_01405 [Aeromonas caviae]|uniref:hypothetical protein n=1 Tax=Aeromonas caviae TaxID=648 RepID=UPI003D2EA086
MHTGNLLGQIPSPLPSEVFADLVSTNNVRIERILSQGQQTPTGEWFDQDEHEWVLLVQGEAILVFITPDTGVQERVHLGPGDYINIPAHLQHKHPGAPSAQGGVDPSDRDNHLALRLLLASSRLKKAMLLLRRSKRRPWRRKKAQSVDWASC